MDSLDLDKLTIVDEELESFREQWKREVEGKAGTSSLGGHERGATGTGPSKGKETVRNSQEASKKTTGAKLEINSRGWVAKSKSEAVDQKSSSSSDNGPTPASAIEIYDLAVKFEREGNLSKALENYQRAFKMDDRIDFKWRQLWQKGELEAATGGSRATEESEHDQPDFSYHLFERETGPFSFETTATVANELGEMPLSFVPKRKNKSVPLAIVPDELILVLLKQVAWMDVYALLNVGLVNKKLYMLTREQVVWRDLCEKTYRPNVPSLLSLANELPSYSGDWKLMFLKRPRVRYDGLYISRCHYWRPGESEYGLSKPYILVTYFRYLRFYRDGSAISLCSTIEPIDAVKLLRKPPKNVKSLMVGTWTMSGNRAELVLTDKDRANTVFNMKLLVRSTGHSCMNSMKWEKYSSVTGSYDEVEYPLNTLKSFAFSRVRSW